MEQYLPYLIQATAGAVGGNLVGALRRSSSVGPSLNTLLGAAGGLAAAFIVAAAGQFQVVSDLLAGNDGLAYSAMALMGGMGPTFVASLFKRGS